MSKSPVAKRLKEARLAAGLSQKSLGIAAGIDEFSASARMNQYETGKHIPDYSTLSLIGKVLKLPVAFFYADTPELASWIQSFQCLTNAQRAALTTKMDKSPSSKS